MGLGGKLDGANLQELREVSGKYADGAGLYFVVQSSGSAAWSYRYMIAGAAREMGLGPYPAVSLKKAREKAAAAAELKADGIDPLDQRYRLRAAEADKASRDRTFLDFADSWYRTHSAVWKSPVHHANWQQQMTDYVYPIIGDLLVSDIGRREVVNVLMQGVGVGKHRQCLWIAKSETARRIRGRIEVILDAAAAAEIRSTENPARLNQLKPLLPRVTKRVKHHAALPYEDAPSFYAKLRKVKGISARALEFTMLTAARTSEVIEAKWREIDLDAALWTVPPERMKAGVEHRVPLSKTAIGVLERLIRQGVGSKPTDFIFPGASRGKPLSNMAMLKLIKQVGGDETLTTHGLRTTFRGWGSNRTRVGHDVLEAALSHVVTNKTVAAYHRSDLLEKRVPLMRRWAIYLRTEMKISRGSARPNASETIQSNLAGLRASIARVRG